MKKLVIVIVVAAAVLGAWLMLRPGEPPAEPPPVADPATRTTTSAGEVVGYVDGNGARVWKGIPFAAPPVGDGRWRAPQPPAPWDGVREALAFGPSCAQPDSALAGTDQVSDAGIAGQEDCLYLNVWAPPEAAGLPVMLWIHGGGNSIGAASTYDGSNLATRHDVVVVSINYRLGPFGWFAHPDLRRGDQRDDSGNYGTLDAIRALEWTRDNIAAFGGDPGNVTVFGESAGAFDTLAMMASPLAEGLFHRAIVQSGGFQTVPLEVAGGYAREGGHQNSAREITARLLVADGTVADLDAAYSYQADMGTASVRDYLYGKSVDEIFATFDLDGPMPMLDLPNNLGDGHVLPDMSTEEIFSSLDNHNAVPVILGTNRDEVALFMAMSPRWQDSFLWVLPRIRDEETYLKYVYYGSMAWKARGVDSLADDMTAAGNPDVYAYRFDWDEQGSVLGYDLSKAFGAAHGLEIPFVFGDFGGSFLSDMLDESPGRDALSDSMMSYWAEFAYSGDPGRGRDGGEVAWQSWGDDGLRSIILDTPEDRGIRMTDDEVTLAGLKAELAADPAFNREGRCRAFVAAFGMFGYDEAEYRSFGPEGCGDFDPADFALR